MFSTHISWWCCLLIAAAVAALCSPAAAGDAGEPVVRKVIDVAPVWVGTSASYCLLTHGDRQFIAFYDDNRQLTVAARVLGSDQWQFARVDEHVMWDNHNYVTMAIDDNDEIHLSGNMHVVPLIYYRTGKALDITTFQRHEHMVGDQEDRCTYPIFMRGADNKLIFHYRIGHSGNGNEVYNVYDHEQRRWRRMLDQPLTDGLGLRNAYFSGPTLGPDGMYHLVWVWRDEIGAEMNHDLSYARSRDLLHWENSRGQPLELPMTIDTCDIIDPVPVRAGMINGNNHVGFDSQHNVVVTYHKFDADGNTQIYAARIEDGAWKIYQVTDWDVPWSFGGGGSIPFLVHVGRGQWVDGQGYVLPFSHFKYGSGRLVLDDRTFQIIDTLPAERELPAEAYKLRTNGYEGMQVNVRSDSGRSNDPNVRYFIRWEAMGANRDKPREGELPKPTMLQVYEIGTDAGR
ncbi:MAG: BNR repeat-containing protein [Phycisphaeraceae bacterium]|nr:BNR repeat-containing protein [Phycisphaeraceae bacterium]